MYAKALGVHPTRHGLECISSGKKGRHGLAGAVSVLPQAVGASLETVTIDRAVWLTDTSQLRAATAARHNHNMLPTHGAPLKGRTNALCDHLESLPAMNPFQFPDDAGFRAMLEQMKAQGGPQA
jgi:hypothetical protein